MDRTAAELEDNIDRAAEQTQAVIGAVGERLEGAIEDAPRQTASVVQSVRSARLLFLPSDVAPPAGVSLPSVEARAQWPAPLSRGIRRDRTCRSPALCSLSKRSVECSPLCDASQPRHRLSQSGLRPCHGWS